MLKCRMKISKYIYLFLAFVIVQSIAWYGVNQYTNTKIKNLKKSELLRIQTQYNTILKTFENLANTVFNGYINKPEVIDCIVNNDRDKLYKQLEPHYSYLESLDFKQIHFHTPKNISFLRMHKPNKFGDDLTKYRYSVNYVNLNKKSINGLEMGRIVPGFRFVYPIFSKNNKNIHLGSVETSFSVAAFSKSLKELYNVRTNFIIDKNLVKNEIFKDVSKNYSNSIESDSYVTLKQSIDPKILKNLKNLESLYDKKLKKAIKSNLDGNKFFSITTKINGFNKIITFLPVKNIQKNHVGYFVIYRNSEKLAFYEKEIINKFIVGFIIIVGFFFVIFREFRHKDSLKQDIYEKTKKLQETTVMLEEQTVELEEINHTLEDRIEKEVEKNAKQERELFQQSKQAALGDMIGNIAHQWRQPLSAISTSASGMQVTYQINALSDDDFINYTDAIINNAKYLSQTIDDFRDFIRSEKKITRFDVSESVKKCMAIVNSSINNHNLNVQTSYEENLIVNNFDNELQQAVINIFTNSKDALKDNISDSDERIIFIETFKEENKAIISIKDTAGGIPEDIIEKVFEPYFTTKHQSQGTGLGLYMTHQIIIDSMKGSLNVENITFEYNNKTYNGAKFSIILNLA
ncbi:MAG: cache domain-containing protein [Campylobacterota bacterium]|nr:cache domain-containing protein [Campylobacterota bacterium]